MIKEGILYVATGERWVNEARNSIKSYRKYNKNIHSTLVTDKKIDAPEFNTVKIIPLRRGKNLTKREQMKRGTLFKAEGLQSTPYQKTLFLDTDTYFCDRCDELFKLLDYHDMLICHAPAEAMPVYTNGKELEGYDLYNAGMFAYNNTKELREFFKLWLKFYQEKFEVYAHDGGPFMEALLQFNIKTYVLPSIYNFRLPFFMTAIPRKIKIIHGRSNNFEKLEKKLNHRIEHRVWLPTKQKMLYMDRSVLHRWYHELPKSVKNIHKLIHARKKLLKKKLRKRKE